MGDENTRFSIPLTYESEFGAIMFGEVNSKDELGVVIIPSVRYKVPTTVNGLIKSNCPPVLNISTLERVLLAVVPPNVCVVPTPLKETNPLL